MLLTRGVFSLLLLLWLMVSSQPGEAKLGESFQLYKTKVARSWNVAGVQGDGAKNNYRFSLIVPQQQQDASPGYAAGLTITVVDGKITGQSVAIRPGSNPLVGAAMASAHGFAFAYESIGKPIPEGKAQSEAEFNQFTQAIGLAFNAQPQYLRYPGYSGVITVMCNNLGDVIIAAVPAPALAPAPASPPAKPAPPASKPGKR